MSVKDRIQELASKHSMTLAEVERVTGISNGQIRKWDNSSPKADNLRKVADYFDVSTDFLLGRTDDSHYYDLNSKDKLDIGEEVDRMLDGLESEGEANFYGEPMTDDDKEKLRVAMQAALAAAQIQARKKFTPKKYRK